MAHYAFLDDNNIVTQVIVGRDESERDWESYYSGIIGQVCKRTSYNTTGGVHYTDGEPSPDQSKSFRYNYAGIGYTYDEARDAFIPPKPFESWVLVDESCLWEAPVPYPTDGGFYAWDEEAGDWVVPDAEE